MKVLIIDGMNFMHRARAGFQLGPHPLMFNFFRGLRAQIELHKPDRVFYVLEGHPKHRHEALPEYKANRELQVEDPDYVKKVDEMSRFFEGNNDILELMMKCFPITLVKHPDYECDDTIHNIVKAYCDDSSEDKVTCVIVSSDTDFIQTIQRYKKCRLYNPMKKSWVTAPEYDYVTWKALRGDGSDNIPGIPGIGDKTAEKLMINLEALDEYLQSSPENMAIFQRNIGLIRLHDFTDSDLEAIQRHQAKPNWDRVKEVFTSYGFKSIVNDKSWKKFVDTFMEAAKS